MTHSIGQVTTFSSSNLVHSIHAHAAMTIFGRRRWRVPVGSARPSGPPFGFAARRHDLQNLASEPESAPSAYWRLRRLVFRAISLLAAKSPDGASPSP